MKSLKKYAILPALLFAAVVEAQTPPPALRNVPAAEMTAQLEVLKKQIEGDHRHVLHLQALARKEKDVIKLTCINDKLVQIKAQMNLFDSAELQLEATINGDNNDAVRNATFAELEKAGADVKKMREEAGGCAGELELYKQESDTDVDRPELDDPTDTGGFDGNGGGPPDIEPPGYATPFK